MKNIKDFTSAITTPLASIFGSGFLVMVPILVGAVGEYAIYGILLITFVAYNVGNIIRFNIKHVEPLLESGASRTTLYLEKISDFALTVAYVVSVSLYLHILSAFVLTGLHADTVFNEDMLTSMIIITITVIGITKGLNALEFLEKYALLITLVIVFALIMSFFVYDLKLYMNGTGFTMPKPLEHSTSEVFAILAGMLIVVQGFETSRYPGNTYSAELRIQTSKYSQIFSTIVYVVFISLALPIAYLLKGVYDDHSLIILVALTSSFMVVPLIVVAALSQFSAAVADTLAASGSLEEVSDKKVGKAASYLLIAVFAIIVTWSVHTLEIIALASRAFAFYYLLQALVAISVSKKTLEKIYFGVLALILLGITLFALPVG
ncbi:MAG: hypothetical protein DRG09_03590 [Epsilonproteobacteria bacterium]|nr:MAG: hypothetical protein DRG09_03590 [Campylobacterota bacterium]